MSKQVWMSVIFVLFNVGIVSTVVGAAELPPAYVDAVGSVVDACQLVVEACKAGDRKKAKGALQRLKNTVSIRDVNEKNAEGHSGLYLLGEYCSSCPVAYEFFVIEALSKLLKQNAEVQSVRFMLNRNLLHQVAEVGLAESICPLIDAGLDVDEVDAFGETPMLRAARSEMVCQRRRDRNMRDVIEQLLTCKADPNLVDKNGDTPLHCIDSDSTKWLLLVSGADKNKENNKGERPWAYYQANDLVKQQDCCVTM